MNDQWIRLPWSLNGTVGVDLGRRKGTYFERPAMLGLPSVLRPGDVLWDAGCSYGLLSSIASYMVGDSASVIGFEANPASLAAALEIVAANGLESRIRLELGCLGDRHEGMVEFFAVNGAKSVASTRNPEICKFHVETKAIDVPAISLDGFHAAAGLRPPRCIKIDVEGSEYLALIGARELIRSHRPALIIETHGLEVDGIGGSVAALCELLTGYGYPLFDLARGIRITAGEYGARYATRIGHLLAAPLEVDNPTFLERPWRGPVS